MTIDNKIEEPNRDEYSDKNSINYIPFSLKINNKRDKNKKKGIWNTLEMLSITKSYLKSLPIVALTFAGLCGVFYYSESKRGEENKKQIEELRNMDVATYVAERGDSLYKICEAGIKPEDRQKYNDENSLEVVLELNPDINKKTRIINPGQRIRVPYNFYK